MSLKPPTPGTPGFNEWRDLADAADAAGVLGGAAHKPTFGDKAKSLFHVAWAAAKDSPNYDKKAWVYVQYFFEMTANSAATDGVQNIRGGEHDQS